MVPVSEMDLSTVKYEPQVVQAPHLTGNVFRFFIKLLESPIIGPFLMSHLKKENKMIEMLRCTEIPEPPMFVPEYPTQAQSRRVVLSPWRKMVNQKDELNQHWNLFLSMILQPTWNMDSSTPFRHWRIRDFAHAYRSKLISPSVAAENVITAIEESYKSEPHQPLLISFDAAEVREQAAASTQRWFEEGNPISILDGIFIGIKDDIDCYPHPTKGGTTWLHEVRSVKRDAVCVSRLRSCGAILVGKANMHELGMGTTGNNSNHGTVRNPYAPDRYTGGSSSGPAAIVASGICCAAVGCDGGGSVRIPSSLCGVVGLKATIGRTDMGGYAAMLGSSIADKISVRPEKSARLTYESLTSDALFRSFTGSEYVSAQCLRVSYALYNCTKSHWPSRHICSCNLGMMHSSRYIRTSSSRDNYDRFIPNRSAMDMDYAHYMATVGWKEEQNPEPISASSEMYRRLLAEAMGLNRTRILAFRNKPPSTDALELILRSHTCSDYSKPAADKPRKRISQTPEAVKEAARKAKIEPFSWSSRSIIR
ncbi:Fatty acid amide hydrolase [Linum grandiflorum]